MRAKTSLILLLIVACAAWAQTKPAPAKTPATTSATQPTNQKPATTPKKPAPGASAIPASSKTPAAAAAQKAPAAPKPVAQKPPATPPTNAKLKPEAKPKAESKAKPNAAAKPEAKAKLPANAKAKLEAKPAGPAAKPAVKAAVPPPPLRPAVRRDPFLSPVMRASVSRPCSTGGKQCLAVNEIVLKGIARTDNGMLAMVENSARKAYILRENDPVFNGYVVKITMDSVVLRENVMDRLGHQSTRDVTKKITVTPLG